MEGLESDSAWDRDAVINLIELFREQPVLWDASCPDYKIRNKKHDAWSIIASEMKMDRADVERKMRCLIGQFQRTLKKKSGSGASDHVKWFAFNSLLFLKDKSRPRDFRSAGVDRPTQDTQDGIDDEELSCAVVALDTTSTSAQGSSAAGSEKPESCAGPDKEESCPGPMKQQPKKRFLQPPDRQIKKKPSTKEMAEEAYIVMQKLSKEKVEEDQPKDEYDVFGAHVACQIRNLPSKFYQVTAKHRINQVLFDLEMEHLQGTFINAHSSSSSRSVSGTESPYQEPTLQPYNNQCNSQSQQSQNEEKYEEPTDPTDAFINSVLKVGTENY